MERTLQGVTFARRLRKSMTRSEVALWTALRGRQLAGLKFRRQHPLGPYVLDFYCASHRLAVEIDGGVHGVEDQRERDAVRDERIGAEGVRIVRVSSELVLRDRTEALVIIARAAGVAAPPS